MNMCRFVVTAVALTAAGSSSGYWNQIDWNTAQSGSFTNAANWSNGRYPGENAGTADGAYFRRDGAPYTVTFPDGVFTNSAGLQAEITAGDDITFSGLKTEMTCVSEAWGTYGYKIYSGSSVPVMAVVDTGDATRREILSISNFQFRVSRGASSNDIVMDFLSGHYANKTSNQYGTVNFFGMENGSSGGSTINCIANFYPGTSLASVRAVNFCCNAGVTNRLVFSGTDVSAPSFTLQNMGTSTSSLANEFFVTNASTLKISGDMTLACSKGRYSNQYVFSGSLLDIVGKFSVSGDGTNRFAMTDCVWTNGDYVSFSQTSRKTMPVTIRDSHLAFSKNFTFTGAGSVTDQATLQVMLTNSSICAEANYVALNMSGAAEVDLVASRIYGPGNLYQLQLGTSQKAAEPKLILHDSSITAGRTSSFIGQNGSARFELHGSSTFVGLGASTYLGGDGTDSSALYTSVCTGRVDLTDNAVFNAGSYFGIGSRAGCYGIVNVRDNAEMTQLNYNGAPDVYIGRYGSGEVNLYGGSLHGKAYQYSKTIRLGAKESPNEKGMSSLNQYGGVIGADGLTTGIIASDAVGRKSRIRLDGGVAKVASIRGGAGSGAYTTPGTGYAGFFANGGRYAPTAASTTSLAYFDEAKLGAKGLTIDSAFDITVPQNFSDQDDAVGEGRLTLVGVGKKTFTGTMPSVVDAANGGEVVFGTGATLPQTLIVTNNMVVSFEGSATLENLTLGNATSVGVLKLKHGNTLTVTGALDVVNLQLVLDGSFAAGEDIDLFVCPNGISPETEAKFVEAFAKAGLADGTSCRFEKVTGQGGAATLRVKVVTAAPLVIRVEEGAETHTTNILYNASEKLQTIVADGASLTLEGMVGYGALEKTGAGTLRLTNVENTFYPGLLLLEGVLAVTTGDVAALGKANPQNVDPARLGGGVLRTDGAAPVTFPRNLKVEGATATTLATVEATVETTMPPMTAGQGNLMKKGAAPLVFACAGQETMPISATGTATSSFPSFGLHSGFTVFEGEAVFRGTGEGAVLSMPAQVAVGIPEEEELGAQPGLVVDNVKLDLGSCGINVAPNCVIDKDRSFTGYVKDPYVIVTNGAILKVGGYTVLNETDGHYNRQFGKCRTVIDGGELQCSGDLFASAANTGGGYRGWQIAHATYDVRNGGALRAGLFKTRHSVGVNVDHGTVAGYSSTGALVPVALSFESGECTSRWDLVSSDFCVSSISRPSSASNDRNEMHFEDARWSCGDRDLTIGSSNVSVDFFVRGRGLVVAPYEGRTYTVNRTISGTGGLVMNGPGTLRFVETCQVSGAAARPSKTPQYTGTTEVNGGTIDFGGFTLTNMTFAGAGGTVSNVTLVETTIANTNLTYGADLAFEGRTRVDFTDVALTEGQPTVIGHYEGTAPDVTLWRAKGLRVRGQKATFVAADGEILATARTAGLAIIVR